MECVFQNILISNVKVLSQVLCIVGRVGSQAELAPCLELAPPCCLEQSDKLNATPPIREVLLYPPYFQILLPTLETTLEAPRPVQGTAC